MGAGREKRISPGGGDPLPGRCIGGGITPCLYRPLFSRRNPARKRSPLSTTPLPASLLPCPPEHQSAEQCYTTAVGECLASSRECHCRDPSPISHSKTGDPVQSPQSRPLLPENRRVRGGVRRMLWCAPRHCRKQSDCHPPLSAPFGRGQGVGQDQRALPSAQPRGHRLPRVLPGAWRESRSASSSEATSPRRPPGYSHQPRQGAACLCSGAMTGRTTGAYRSP